MEVMSKALQSHFPEMSSYVCLCRSHSRFQSSRILAFAPHILATVRTCFHIIRSFSGAHCLLYKSYQSDKACLCRTTILEHIHTERGKACLINCNHLSYDSSSRANPVTSIFFTNIPLGKLIFIEKTSYLGTSRQENYSRCCFETQGHCYENPEPTAFLR